MAERVFSPGFRCSAVDVAVLLLGTVVWVVLPPIDAKLGLFGELPGTGVAWLLAMPVLAFFLFCNLFRVSRSLELLWAGSYVILAKLTIDNTITDWRLAVLAAAIGIAIAVVIETRKPSYHGIGWQRLNPELPNWWNQQVRSFGSEET